MDYFYEKAKGLKADIERHRQHEKELKDKIEKTLKEPDNSDKERKLGVYKNFLSLLLQSKTEVVSKIGK